MNLKQALDLAAEKLAALKDIDTPTLESEVLLRHCLGLNRSAFHLQLKRQLTPEQASSFFGLVGRRLAGEPIAYIIGRREFFGLDFYVDSRVLIPRPETELLVEETLKLVRGRAVHSIADIGTGSGIIAVSLAVALFGPDQRPPPSHIQKQEIKGLSQVLIFASDISTSALEVARRNARAHAVEDCLIFRQGDLLASLPQKVDLIIANLPYVTTPDVLAMPSAQFEPHLALDGGPGGLELIERLAGQLPPSLNPGGYAILEIGFGQSAAVVNLLLHNLPGSEVQVLPDLAGIERVVKLKYLPQSV